VAAAVGKAAAVGVPAEVNVAASGTFLKSIDQTSVGTQGNVVIFGLTKFYT
jgi:hypothetical protein